MKLKSQGEKRLETSIRRCGKIAIAISGGYDSSFLAKFAIETIGKENVLPVHIRSAFSPSRDERSLAKFAAGERIGILILRANPLAVAKIAGNPPDRCYHCKRNIMGLVVKEAGRRGFAKIADGTNLDDISEHRPGLEATNELGILHPLLDAKLTKRDMIAIAEKRGFDLSFSPSSSCLATRIPHGTKLDRRTLKMADDAENILCEFRIPSPRVRVLGRKAVIEVAPGHIPAIIGNRDAILGSFSGLGFQRIFLDLEGYRKK